MKLLFGVSLFGTGSEPINNKTLQEDDIPNNLVYIPENIFKGEMDKSFTNKINNMDLVYMYHQFCMSHKPIIIFFDYSKEEKNEPSMTVKEIEDKIKDKYIDKILEHPLLKDNVYINIDPYHMH